MKFRKLAEYFSQLEQTPSRLKMTEILSRLLKEASASEVAKICYLSQGRLGPLYASLDFNLADKMMVRVLSQAFSVSVDAVWRQYKRTGDLGEVAENLKDNTLSLIKRTTNDLSVGEAYDRLYEIAAEAGGGSVERKIGKMAVVLQNSDKLSVRYLVRIPLAKLRLGFSDLTILDGLSWMIAGNKEHRPEIEAAYNVRADIGQIAEVLKESGIRGLGSLDVLPGTPVVAALCQRLSGPEEMIEKMGEVAAEPKYDGTRLQMHVLKDKAAFMRTYTRNLEDTTTMFPEFIKAVGEIRAKKVVLDGEAVGFDPRTGKFLPFQMTIQRKRKYSIGEKSKEVPLKYFVFDILSRDGTSLLKTPFAERRKVLEKILDKDNKTIVISPQIVTREAERLRQYHDEQIAKGLEGIVVKKLASFYEPGRRDYNWVKFKQENIKESGGLADTIDGLVMGYYRGKGRRAGFGIGKFLVGVISNDKKLWLGLTKIGTGLSDEQFREMKKRCDKLKAEKQPANYRVHKNLLPDVWCRPALVVEIGADNITRSSVYGTGYSLRFPRWLRFRDDKSSQGATTVREIGRLYSFQTTRIKNDKMIS